MKKKIIAVLFKSSGIIDDNVLETQKTVTSKRYTGQYLPKVIESLKNCSQSQEWTSGVSTMTTLQLIVPKPAQVYLTTSGLKPLQHNPYSSDIAFRNFTLFSQVEIKLKGCFFNDKDLLRAGTKSMPHS